MSIETESGARAFSKAAIAWFVGAIALLLLGIGMQQSREVFEPILQFVVPLIGRRGHHMAYDPATYPGYAVMPFVLSGVSVVLSGFAGLFSVAMRGSRQTPQE